MNKFSINKNVVIFSLCRVKNMPTPVSAKRKKDILHYAAKYGRSRAASFYSIHPTTISRWKRQSWTPFVAKKPKKRGPKKKLSSKEARKLELALLKDPFLTNAELVAKVGNKISPQAAGTYIKRSSLKFVHGDVKYDEPETFTNKHLAEGEQFLKVVRHIPFRNRIYIDETFISGSLSPRKGRFPTGHAPHLPKRLQSQRLTVWGCLGKQGLIRPSVILEKSSPSTEDFEQFVMKDLVPFLKPGQVVLWDRWGRSGRAKNPTAHHYSPKARRAIERCGAKLVFLPPKGKYWSPIELAFRDIKARFKKQLVRKAPLPAAPNLRFNKLVSMWREAEKRITQHHARTYFTVRANGRDFFKSCRAKGLRGCKK